MRSITKGLLASILKPVKTSVSYTLNLQGLRQLYKPTHKSDRANQIAPLTLQRSIVNPIKRKRMMILVVAMASVLALAIVLSFVLLRETSVVQWIDYYNAALMILVLFVFCLYSIHLFGNYKSKSSLLTFIRKMINLKGSTK